MNFFLHAVPGLKEHLRRQRNARQLEDMPDYLLDDIGLLREQVNRARRSLPF